jgi:Dolichyl-phosphate-mannose-protein mannosyltransferase
VTSALADPEAPARPGPAHQFAWILGAIVLAAFVLRVVYILTARQDFIDAFTRGDLYELGDAYLYQKGAVLLVEGKGFISPYLYDQGIRQQDASHPPLFTLWLAIPSLLGLKTALEHALWSAVLGAGTIVVVGLAGREMFSKRAGLIAAVLAAIYPNVFSHDGFLQSETMAIFTVTLTVWLAYRFWHRPSMWNAAWVAGGCGLATLSRSELSVLVIALFVPLVLVTKPADGRTRWKWLGAGAVALALVVGPWVAFNLARFDRPEFISDNFGYTLLTATCDNTYYGPNTGYWEFGCALDYYKEIDAARHDRSRNDALFRDKAFDYIKSHKRRLPVVTLARWQRFFGVWDLTHDFDQVHKDQIVEGREGFVAWGGAIGWFIMLPFAIYGLVAMRRRRITLIPVLAPYIAALTAVTLTFYMNRYRASTEAVLCLLAAVGVDALLSRRARRATRPLATLPPQVNDAR